MVVCRARRPNLSPPVRPGEPALGPRNGAGAGELERRLHWHLRQLIAAVVVRGQQRSGVLVGAIPGYALWPDGGLCDTVLYDRELGAG